MSEPKRYSAFSDGRHFHMKETQKGGWVHYNDYASLKEDAERYRLASLQGDVARLEIARLKAEVEELKLENSQYEEHHKYGQNVITSLREEVERLTKAGDNLEQVLTEISYSYRAGNASHEWRAAKGGKQS